MKIMLKILNPVLHINMLMTSTFEKVGYEKKQQSLFFNNALERSLPNFAKKF